MAHKVRSVMLKRDQCRSMRKEWHRKIREKDCEDDGLKLKSWAVEVSKKIHGLGFPSITIGMRREWKQLTHVA